MDIEKLTKTQIILLTLLVSFITSIATGIVTVTLLDQAPPAITQTINRVVERTVEKVVPGEPQRAAVIEKETTVVVKEDDIITDSINKNSKKLVRISKKIKLEDGTESKAFAGLGIIVSKDGIIATDSIVVSDDFNYSITTSDKNIFDAEAANLSDDSPIAFLKAVQPERGSPYAFLPVTLSGADKSLKLGQTVISLSGENRTDVAIGIISSLVEKEVITEIPAGSKDEGGSAAATTTVIAFIRTDINDNSALYGSPLVDIFGEVIGLNTKNTETADGTALYTPAFVINSLLSELEAAAKNSDAKEKN